MDTGATVKVKGLPGPFTFITPYNPRIALAVKSTGGVQGAGETGGIIVGGVIRGGSVAGGKTSGFR